MREKLFTLTRSQREDLWQRYKQTSDRRVAERLHAILLLDEGLATGDVRFATRAEERLKHLIARSSILVLASHSDVMIKTMCNRCALLEKGHLISIGPVEQVIDLYHQRTEGHAAAIGGTVAIS